jgi:hypothetical protein
MVAHVADHRIRIRVHHIEPAMELRILIVVASEHEEVLGGRSPALVRRSVRGKPSAGMSATASTTTSAGTTAGDVGQRRKGGAFDPVVAVCAA